MAKAKKKPSLKAKKAYVKNIIKSYKRLEAVVAKHSPKELVHRPRKETKSRNRKT